ncbi:MAG: DNA-protecting protein DprA [Ruminococcaceae bacterium]|nr:DNA-protecting protein DprA [Oscillospiraceae bacterium]
MKNCEFWIWLERTLGPGAVLDDIINYYGSAADVYQAGRSDWILTGLLNGKQIQSLTRFSPSESAKIINDCQRNNWQIITPDDAEYPPLLRTIRDFPAVLYADGNTELLYSEQFIAMVGTRKASAYGIKSAGIISGQLSNAGMCIVSGGALGIDTAAHEGALTSGHPTVCVLGCGLGTDYLRENYALRNEIRKNGVIITEYPPFTPASRYTFPKRNRIISGMSLGTVVVEAGERSGSLITARLASEQGRDVYAIPGSVFASSFNGANKLISDGAKPVFTAKDILEEYYYRYPDKIKTENTDIPLSNFVRENSVEFEKPEPVKIQREVKRKAVPETVKEIKKTLPDSAGETAKMIYGCFKDEATLDEIAENTALDIRKILTGITELEMYGVIEMMPGNKYRKK